MDYEGLEPADLANVEALNRAFLLWLRDPSKRTIRDAEVASLARRLSTLNECEIARLSRTPFLLMSIQDRDERRWRAVFENRCSADLFDGSCRPGRQESSILMATLGFLWSMARRNPYAARLVSGTSLEWCDQLAGRPVMEVFEHAAQFSPPVPRRADDSDFWRKLIDAGTSIRKDVRLAARISALHTTITRSAAKTTTGPVAVAACDMPPVSMQVTDRRRG